MEGGSYAGGSWSTTMIPSIPSTHSNPTTPSNHQQQDHLYLQQQFNQQPFQQQQQQFDQQQFQQQSFQSQQQQQLQRFQQQQQHHQSLASHFHLLHLVENFADAVENGTRDQHFDALVSELNNQFEKCQQLLNSIASSISSKAMTVEGQKQKLEESKQLLNQRRLNWSDFLGHCFKGMRFLVSNDVRMLKDNVIGDQVTA